MKIAILDDEKLHIKRMKEIIEKLGADLELDIDGYTHSQCLLDSEEDYDIIFVDMELKEKGRNDEGMNVVREYRQNGKDALIIFVTTHDELARDGYKVKAFGYVYKGELEKELTDVLVEAFDEIGDNRTIEFTTIKEKKKDCNKRTVQVLLKDIMYFETELRHLRIYLENESFLVNMNIKSLLDELKDDRFHIVHKSYVVNMTYAVGINAKELVLKNGQRLPIGRVRREEIEKAYWMERRRRR